MKKAERREMTCQVPGRGQRVFPLFPIWPFDGKSARMTVTGFLGLGMLLVVIGCAAVVLGQDKPTLEPPNQVRSTQGSPSDQSTGATLQAQEVKLLTDQLATVREYDQRLLNTVLWSLSGVFLLVILLGSYSWFTNFRVYNRDLESIRQQIRVDVQQEAATLRTAAAQEREIFRQKMLEQLGQFTANVSAQLDQSRLLVKQEESVREKSDGELKDFATKIAKSSALAVQREMNMFRYAVSDFETHYFEKAEDSYRLLDCLVEHLQVLADLDWISHTGHSGAALRDIQKCMEKTGATISYANHEKLLNLLGRMPPPLQVEVDAVRSLLARIGRL